MLKITWEEMVDSVPHFQWDLERGGRGICKKRSKCDLFHNQKWNKGRVLERSIEMGSGSG